MLRPDVSIIMPCLNEERSVGICIDKVRRVIARNGLKAEIIIVDNGSTDKSVKIIKKKKVCLVHESKRGYGNAYLAGIRKAKAEIIIMTDSDGSYNFDDMSRFIDKIKEGYDFVIGNRFNDRMQKGAMPLINKFGNMLIRLMLRLNGLKTKEVCTGFVATKKSCVEKLCLKQPGMEFSSEILVRMKESNCRIAEIDITYFKRIGKPKLRRMRDGLRHTRFLLGEYIRPARI